MGADLVIKGGTVVDGSGTPPVETDVVVAGDRIVSVGRHDGPATEVIDARGLVVTPGFVDVHTHLDAQLTWDPSGAPASWHGITSVVVGNCGVGFAPCRERDRDYLMFLMEGVEDIPRAALAAGMRWEWESFGDYLGALGRLPLGLNVGAHVTHAPLRIFAMGEPGATDAAPSDVELELLATLVDEALSAGALGLSTGRTTMHRTPAGEPVPGTFADRRELAAMVAPLVRRRAGVLQMVPLGAAGEAAGGFARDLDFATDLVGDSGVSLSLGLTQPRAYPDEWRDSLARVDAARGRGVHITLQAAPRSIGLLLGPDGLLSPLILFPDGMELAGAPLEAQRAALSDPARRRRLLSSVPENGDLLLGLAAFDRVFVLDGEGVGSYETTWERSLAGRAARTGVSPGDLLLDLLLESSMRQLFMVAVYNRDLDATLDMLRHPATLPSLGDAGAHTAQTCDVGVPTYVLAYWVRDRRALPLEDAVRRLTAAPAAAWGIPGRGLVRAGCAADLNVIDLDRLDLRRPEVRHDLPTGAPNLSQRARGYCATIVNGQVTIRDDEPTGLRAGRVLRGAGTG